MAGRFDIETVFKARDMVSGAMRRMGSRVSASSRRMEKSLRGVDRRFGQIHGGIMRAGRAAMGIGVAGGAAAFAIGKTGAEFEQAITGVGAVGLKTRDQIADLEAKAKDLGATTKFTATEAANAMETMARAGFTNAEILSGVDGVLSAAAASGLEMEEVANHVSNALKGMGIQASEAGRVADVLALASSKTNSSIGSLGESLSNVSSTARQFGIPLEDVVAGVALLQDVGLDASVAGSAMNTMLTKMAKPSSEVAAKMKKFGVTFKDAEGNMLPFQDVLANISKAAEKSGGNMDQVAFLADLVGLRGQKAAANLKDLFTSGKVGELTDQLKAAEGSAAKMAAIKMDNTIGDFTLLDSAIDAVKVALFETESGPLRGIIQKMTAWVTANKDLIVSGFSEFMSDLKDALPTIVTWLGRIGKVLVVFYSFALAIKAATAAMTLFNIITAANPIMLWAVGIAAAIALIWAFWPEISAFFTQLWDDVKDISSRIVSAVGGFLSSAWGPIKGFLVGAYEFILGIFQTIFAPQIAGVKVLFGIIKSAAGWIMTAWQPVSQFFSELWSGISTAVSSAWTGIVEDVGTFLDDVKEAVRPIGEFFSGIWNGIAESFTSAFSWIFEKVSWFVGAMRAVGRGEDPPAQTSSPSGRAASATADASANVNGRIEVAGPPGTKTSTGKGHSPGIGLVPAAPSGAF